MVGSPGAADERMAVEMPSPRTRPARIWARAVAEELNDICICPAIKSVVACAAPLYATCVSCTPAIDANNSLITCAELPLPPLAKLSFFGCALASAINSFTVFAGSDGCTINTIGAEVVSVTGAKSR